MTAKQKIVQKHKLIEIVAAARTDGKTVVQCHGCFDIVHPGHIRYLEFARQLGEVLIVSITGDADVQKGDQRPYIPQELRAENLAALSCVDYVYTTLEPTAEKVLADIKPDFYVKGSEYEQSRDPGFLAEKSVVEAYGGRIVFSSGEIVFSSTALIERMSNLPALESQRVQYFGSRYDINMSSMTDLLDRMKDIRVLVVGDVVIDRYVICDPLGAASESPMMNLAIRDERTFVGGAAIVARHLAALGAGVSLLCAGPEDKSEANVQVGQTLADEGVACQQVAHRPTLVEKTRFLADDVKLFKVDRGVCLPLDSIAERRVARVLEMRAKDVDAVVFCDFGYGMITGSLLRRVLPVLRQHVPWITADISGERANLLNFEHVGLLCPTELELRAAVNNYDAGLSAVAWELLKRTQARHLFVTMQKRGMVVFERGSQLRSSPEWSGRLKSEQLPSFAENTLDRLGCGDAMLAASTLALAARASLMEAAYLGNAAAAVEIAMLGNHPVTSKAMRDWLSRRPELRITARAEKPTSVAKKSIESCTAETAKKPTEVS